MMCRVEFEIGRDRVQGVSTSRNVSSSLRYGQREIWKELDEIPATLIL